MHDQDDVETPDSGRIGSEQASESAEELSVPRYSLRSTGRIDPGLAALPSGRTRRLPSERTEELPAPVARALTFGEELRSGVEMVAGAANQASGSGGPAAAQTAIVPPPNPGPPVPPRAVTAAVIPAPAPRAAAPTASRIKYTKFKGDGSQKVDDWWCEWLAATRTNEEPPDRMAIVFQGLLLGEARKWFDQLDPAEKDDITQLEETFLKEFREVGGSARAFRKLNTLKLKKGEGIRHYTQRFRDLLSRFGSTNDDTTEKEWYIGGFPESMQFDLRKENQPTVAGLIKSAHHYENSAGSLQGAIDREEEKWQKVKKQQRTRTRHHRHKYDSLTESESDLSDGAASCGSSSGGKRDNGRKSESRKKNKSPVVAVKEETGANEELRGMMDATMEAVKNMSINVAAMSKPRKGVTSFRPGIWCTKCHRQGHNGDECPRPQPTGMNFVEAEPTNQEEEVVTNAYFTGLGYQGYGGFRAATQGRGSFPPRQGSGPGPNNNTLSTPTYTPAQVKAAPYGLKPPGYCWSCGRFGHISRDCPDTYGNQGEFTKLCTNCRKEGHGRDECPEPEQKRALVRMTPTLAPQDTALNYGKMDMVECPPATGLREA